MLSAGEWIIEKYYFEEKINGEEHYSNCPFVNIMKT